MRTTSFVLFSRFLFFLLMFLCHCSPSDQEILSKKIKKYYAAWNRQDFNHPDYTQFTNDTTYTWHGEKNGDGIMTIFGPNSGWKQWDIAWNGTYRFEITDLNLNELKVSGQFHETTDFLKIIGMPEGFSAIVTYWFDKNLRVKETQYDWSPDNKSIHDVIKPYVDWAKKYDSVRIQNIYLENGFVPSKENADEWKILFANYDARNNP